MSETELPKEYKAIWAITRLGAEITIILLMGVNILFTLEFEHHLGSYLFGMQLVIGSIVTLIMGAGGIILFWKALCWVATYHNEEWRKRRIKR